MSGPTLPLTVPPPQFLFDPPSEPPALEKPVNVRVGVLRFDDGTDMLATDARMVGLFLYRRNGGTEELWNEATKTWTTPPGTLDALMAGFKPLGLMPDPPPPPIPLPPEPPPTPVPPAWNGLVVAVGQKDAGGNDRFVKASGGAPAYRVRALGTAERDGVKYAGLSDPSADLLFVSTADSQRFAVVLDPSPKAPTRARMVLKNSALVEVGYVEIKAAAGPIVEIANCTASGTPLARITLQPDGSIQLTPGGGGTIVLTGTVLADRIDYRPGGTGGRVTL